MPGQNALPWVLLSSCQVFPQGCAAQHHAGTERYISPWNREILLRSIAWYCILDSEIGQYKPYPFPLSFCLCSTAVVSLLKTVQSDFQNLLPPWTHFRKTAMEMQTERKDHTMSSKKHVYSKALHNFLIFFFLWACAAFAVLYGIRFIYYGQMNGYHGMPMIMLILVNGLQIILGGFLIKVRFDLAAYRSTAPRELVISCIAGAVLCLANYWVEDISGDDYNRALLTFAFIFVCWAIALYRYYKMFPDVFNQ